MAAKRELVEETGCTAERFEELCSFYPNPATHNNRVHCFLAHGTKPTDEPNLDLSENIHHQFVSIPKAMEMIDSGEFSQALHIASILMALRKLRLLA